MKIVIIGQKWFGAEALSLAGEHAAAVIAPRLDDRLAQAATARGVPVHCLSGRPVGEIDLPGRYDMLISAHAHWHIPATLRDRFACAIGYHPSLLPLHRGRRAVEDTIAAGDRLTGGTVYHLDDGFDTGAVAFQDWCFVAKGESAADFWRDRLAPIGLDLIERAIGHFSAFGFLPAQPQEEELIISGREAV